MTDPEMSPKMSAFADLTAIIAFLGSLEREQPNATFGGQSISGVIDAFCRVSGIERYKIDSVLRALAEKKDA